MLHKDARQSIRREAKIAIVALACLAFLFQCIGPAPTTTVRRILWNQDDVALQQRLASHLMQEVSKRRSDGAQSAILEGRPVPDCTQQLTRAGFTFIGTVEEGAVYRLDRMSFLPLIQRNFIVTCGSNQVRVYVGMTGL